MGFYVKGALGAFSEKVGNVVGFTTYYLVPL